MTTRRSAALIAVLVAATSGACSRGHSSANGNGGALATGSKTATATERVPPVEDAALRSVLDAWMRRSRVLGAVVAVRVGDKEPVFATAGRSDRRAPTALTDAAAFRIGGVTKTFVGAVALLLSERGHLDLDARIDRWLPKFPNAHRITVRNLLTHRSGLAPFGDESGAPGRYAAIDAAFVAAHPRHAFTPEEIIAYVQSRPLLAKPGTAVHISNVNTLLLGIIVADVAHSDLATALHDQLSGPLGLGDSYYAATERRAPGPVSGTTLDVSDVTALGAAGAMVSTARDLLSFSNAFLGARARGERDLSASAFRIGKGGTGLGVEGVSNDGFCAVSRDGCAPGTQFVALGATGSIPGGSAVVLYDPAYDVSVVALATSDRVDVAGLALRADLLSKLGRAGYDKTVGFTAHLTPTTRGA
jgi:D-alanyl-D-alanine carboxypeptidase